MAYRQSGRDVHVHARERATGYVAAESVTCTITIRVTVPGGSEALVGHNAEILRSEQKAELSV